MPTINKIAGYDNNYTNNNTPLFKSKFVPNEALKDALYIAHVNANWTTNYRADDARSFARIIEHLLNDGKDDLIKVTRSEKGSTMTINGERVNFYRETHKHPGMVDGERVIKNVIDYFTKKEIVDTTKLTSDELKAIKPSINELNSELNADDVTKNPRILYNLRNNIYNIKAALYEHTDKLIEKLEATIFKKSEI